MTPFRERKKFRMECPVCEQERDLLYGETKESLKIRGEKVEVTSMIHYCPEGNHYFYTFKDEEAKFKAAYDEYRDRKNFLKPNEIRELREQYKLSQKNFARLLGWGEITIHRYESGALQDDAHNNVLVFIKNFDNFKRYFTTIKGIDPILKGKIEKRIAEIEREEIYNLLQQFYFAVPNKKQAIPNITAPTYSGYSEDVQCVASNNELAIAA